MTRSSTRSAGEFQRESLREIADVFGDPDRLKALASSGLLDTSPEEGFDRLTRIASNILGVSITLVALVDDKRAFYKSQQGLPEPWASTKEAPLTHTFCQYVVASGAPLIVNDARRHPLLRNYPAVKEKRVLAYLGVPLKTASGHTLGAFCAADPEPRVWTPRQIEVVHDLAAAVMREIDLRLEQGGKIRLPHVQPSSALRKFGAELFHALAHPTRIGIVELLRDQELSAGMLVELLDLERVNTSQHLSVLRSKNIVVGRKDGNQIFYSLRDPALTKVLDVVQRYFKSHLAGTRASLKELDS